MKKLQEKGAHKNERLVSLYLEILECGCDLDEPKYGDDSDPLAQDWREEIPPERLKVFDLCMGLQNPLHRMKCLNLLKSLNIGFGNPEYANRVDREIEAITGNYEPSGEI